MTLTLLFFITVLLLCGTFLLTALSTSLRNMHKRGALKQFQYLGSKFFYRKLHVTFFPDNEYESLLFAITIAQNITRFFLILFAVIFLYQTPLFQNFLAAGTTPFNKMAYLWIGLSIIGFILISFVVGDYLPRILGTRYPEATVNVSAPLSSLFLVFAFPVTALFLKLTRLISRTVYLEHIDEQKTQVKQEIIELVRESNITEKLDENEKKLISSVLSFCEHLTREVMIPRVDMFGLEAHTTIREAAKLLEEEGFSRVPVYEDNIDNIIGVLMYKDVLGKYMEYELKNNDPSILEAPISSIQKIPLYTPETKKISDLLQEFKKKHTHLAIVVDEYGGTEGIITIEDILEDIVGEIADEYDEEEELFSPLPNGTWIVDPRISILDAEEQLGIVIPQEGDYDTLGGYIFHCAGEIPKRGFKIQSNEFELEVLKSNDRMVQKVRIRPLPNPDIHGIEE